MSFNLGDLLEQVEQVLPADAEALVCGDRRRSWAQLARRSNNLARALLDGGAKPGDKVAFYLRNGNEYMETLAACFKARLIHVNVNYRYLKSELGYLFDNSDASVVVYSAEFRDRLDALRPHLPKVKLYLEAGDHPPADFARHYEEFAEAGDGQPLEIERSPDDLLFLYTGGTTGYPKGVMWEHQVLQRIGARAQRQPPATSLREYGEQVRSDHPAQRLLPACPMMHGTGLLTALNTMLLGGCVVSIPSLKFDPEQLWDTVQQEQVNSIAIVGDAFAKPMVQSLTTQPDRWDISSLISIVSSGVMWSPQVKQEMLQHNENLVLVDTYGASESLGFGGSVTSKKSDTPSAVFTIPPEAKVFDDDHRELQPGSEKIGMIALSGNLPAGYYKDPEKTARTFPVIDGVRYVILGDYCRIKADGTIVLLGRGSACINSGGEKIYSEEVEEVLKRHPAVEDALVFGIADDKWGQAVTAVVLFSSLPSGGAFDESDLQQFARSQLAAYKVPKRIFPTEDMGRAANGKADYSHVREYALKQMTQS